MESSDKQSEFLPLRHRKGRRDENGNVGGVLMRKKAITKGRVVATSTFATVHFSAGCETSLQMAVMLVAWCYVSHDIAIFETTSRHSLMYKRIQWVES